MIHQRPHPPYYREDYKTEPFYMDFGLDQLDFIEIIDEGPFWSRKLLEICGGLGHVSFTDAWTICLEWYLYHNHGLKRTNFLKEPVIHRTLHENIDTEKSERWSTDRLYNFDFIQGDFYRSMVKNQARNISLNILAETKISDLISSDRQASPADRDQIVLLKKLLGTAQGALRYGRKEAALSEFKRFVEQFPNFPEGHHGLGLTLVLMSRFQEAVLPLHQAVELAPEQVEYHNDLGVAYASAGDVERAETAFLSELELNPENIDTKLNLADIYRVQGRIGDAIALIEPHAKGDSPHPGVIKTLRALVNEVSSRPFVQPPAGQTVPRPAEPNKAQKSSPLPHPNVVFMHMIDRCNARCLFCDDAYIAHKTGHRISFDQFQQIARNVNFTKVKMVIFTGGGEPLLHDELCGMIQFMNSEYPGTMVGVNSNAIALTRDLSERLAEYQIGLMSVSLNAATKETYKKIMQVDAFDKVIANLKVYQEIHTGLDKNNLRLTFAACRSSVEELPKFVELSARLRVMDCQTSYMQLWPGDVRQTMAGKGKEALHWFSEEESLFNHQTLSDRMAAESRKKAEQWGVPFMTEALFSEELARTVCRQPFESFLISFDGETYPCCGGDTLFRKSKRSFGNILTTPFPDIWNSEAYDRLRQTVTHPDNPPQTGECGICPTYWKGRRGLERRFFIIDRFLEHPEEAKGLIADKKAAVPDGDDSAPKNTPILSEEREGDPSQTNGPSLSILIPSLREAQLKRCLERIEAHTKDVDYEVVVISPFEVSGPRIDRKSVV
jgi:MoaA/NifB/PqqE/SkfB family radical SAM enzyme